MGFAADGIRPRRCFFEPSTVFATLSDLGYRGGCKYDQQQDRQAFATFAAAEQDYGRRQNQ